MIDQTAQLIEDAKDTMGFCDDFVQRFVSRLRAEKLDSTVHQAVMHLMDEWEMDGVYTGQSGCNYWDKDAWVEAVQNFPCSQIDLARAQAIFSEMDGS